MFLEILQTLMKVLMVFSILIIAFGLAFFILMSKVKNVIVALNRHFFPYRHACDRIMKCFVFSQTSNNQSANHLSFSSIPMSLLRTFSMMLGEMDFVGTYVQPFYTNELTFPIPTFLLLCRIFFFILLKIGKLFFSILSKVCSWFSCRFCWWICLLVWLWVILSQYVGTLNWNDWLCRWVDEINK